MGRAETGARVCALSTPACAGYNRPMTDTILATLSPAPARRWLSSALVFALAVIFLVLATTSPVAGGVQRILMLAVGLLCLWIATLSYRGHGRSLVLTQSVLMDSEGAILAHVEEITSVDRGTFAFKPSNGFMLRLSSRAPRSWVPGLYWRIGDRLAIGGATQPAETRNMADQLGLLIAERQRG